MTLYQLWVLPEPWTAPTYISHKAILFSSFSKGSPPYGCKKPKRRSCRFGKKSFTHGGFEWVQIFFFLPDNVSLNLLKVTLTFLKKIQHGVIVSWGDVTLEQKPLLTWLKVFFSLYVSRLPLLFRELWNRSKRHSVKEGSRGGGKGAPTLGGHYLHWSETHKDRVLLPPLKSRNRLESTFQCSK